jgi:hypothetical protein
VALERPEAGDNAHALRVKVTTDRGDEYDRLTYADPDSGEVGWFFPD